jgi:hypothetical protein
MINAHDRRLKAMMLLAHTWLASCGGVSTDTTTTSVNPTTVGSIQTSPSAVSTTVPEVSTTVYAPPLPEFPSHWAGLGIDPHQVGLLSTETGEPVWLFATDAEPATPGNPEGPELLFGASLVRMGPGNLTYVETCCEPAAGAVMLVDESGTVDGGGGGYSPAASPDGTWLASTSGAIEIAMQDRVDAENSIYLSHPPDGRVPVPGTDPISLSNHTSSLDATRLAFNYNTNTAIPSLLILDPFTATSAADATVVFAGEQTTGANEAAPAWYLPVLTDVGLAVALTRMQPPFDVLSTDGGLIVDPATGFEIMTFNYRSGRVIDQDTDVSGHYLIYVLDDGSVHWLSTAGESGTLADKGFTSASW